MSEASALVQCEEFIQIVIDEEPARPWLYYCLGLINRRGKGDLASARRDFETFIRMADENEFPRQFEVARKWIREIDSSSASVTS